jgi:hypothetical protein
MINDGWLISQFEWKEFAVPGEIFFAERQGFSVRG